MNFRSDDLQKHIDSLEEKIQRNRKDRQGTEAVIAEARERLRVLLVHLKQAELRQLSQVQAEATLLAAKEKAEEALAASLSSELSTLTDLRER